MRTRRARVALGAVAVAALLLTSACNSGKPSGSTSNAADAGNAGTTANAAADTGKTAIFVIGGKSDDPFWSKVKRGVDDAAKVVQAQGGSVTFLGPQNYDNLGPDAAKLIDSALSQGATRVAGLAQYQAALKLHPESAIAMIEYANGLVMLEGEKRMAEATRLYERAAACEPRDAAERLDVEMAKAGLED